MLNKLLSGLLPGVSLETPDSQKLQTWHYVVLAVFGLIFCYYGVGAYPILDMNEGLYAEIAREMLVTGNYLIPHLNGVPYLEKPPLLYWLIALSFHAFGINAFAARVVPCTAMLFAGVFTFYFLRKTKSERCAWLASLMLFTSAGFVVIGHVVFFDMLLTTLIIGSMVFFYLWYANENTLYLYLSYGFLGFAVLTKGFVALVLLFLIAIFFLRAVGVEKEKYKAFFNKKAMALFLAIILPWHILGMLFQSGFTWEYFVNDQILRFFNLRIPHDYHHGPLYYYIPRLIVYILPWSVLLPMVFRWPIRFQLKADPFRTFCWIWFLTMFLFFSLSGDKGSYYMVIGTPPLIYLLALKIDQWFEEGKAHWLRLVFLLIAGAETAAALIALLFYQGSRLSTSPMTGNTVPYMLNSDVMIFFIVMAVLFSVGFYFTQKNSQKPLLPFLLLCVLMIPALVFFVAIKEKTATYYSQAALGRYVKAQYEAHPVYLYRDFERISSFVFYDQQICPVVDSLSKDLYFGSTTKQAKGLFITGAQLMAVAQKQSVYVVTRKANFASFEQLPGANQFCAVQQNGDVLLLSNAAQDCKPTSGYQKEVPKDLGIVGQKNG